MDTEQTRAIVTAVYAAYARRDFDHVASVIHEDIDWVIFAPVEIFTFAGVRHGRRAVLEAFAGIAAQYSVESYKPELILADGDRAAVMSDVSFLQRASGRILRFRIANFLQFRDGKLVEFREFMNTFDVAEQAVGHFIKV